MRLDFITTLPRLLDELEVTVVAEATWDDGEPGSLMAAGWQIDPHTVTDTATGLPVNITDEDAELLRQAALRQL